MLWDCANPLSTQLELYSNPDPLLVESFLVQAEWSALLLFYGDKVVALQLNASGQGVQHNKSYAFNESVSSAVVVKESIIAVGFASGNVTVLDAWLGVNFTVPIVPISSYQLDDLPVNLMSTLYGSSWLYCGQNSSANSLYPNYDQIFSGNNGERESVVVVERRFRIRSTAVSGGGECAYF